VDGHGRASTCQPLPPGVVLQWHGSVDAPCPDGGARRACSPNAGRGCHLCSLRRRRRHLSKQSRIQECMGLQATSRQAQIINIYFLIETQSSTLNHPVLLAFTVSPEGE